MSRKVKNLLSKFRIDELKSRVLKPLLNRKAFGATDLILIILVTITLSMLSVYYMASMEHESVTNGLNSEANAILDTVNENRDISAAIHNHYAATLSNNYKFYMSDYKVTYSVYEVTDTSVTKTMSFSVAKSGVFPQAHIPLKKGDIVRVVIESTNETLLTKATKLVGGSQVTDVVGFSEGGVD